MSERTNPITPAGYRRRCASGMSSLFAVERPAVVEIVHWAAGNGDRSENGDYIYGKQKLRAIDRELGPAFQEDEIGSKSSIPAATSSIARRIFFGATVTLADIDDLLHGSLRWSATMKPMRAQALSAGTHLWRGRYAGRKWAT